MAKKAHHYIPEFYLRLFVDPVHAPNLWRYERGQAEPKRLPPETIAVQSHYYAVPTPEGGKDQIVEEMLSQLESAAAPVIKSLVNDPGRALSPDERGALAAFTASMLTRVPFFRGMIEDFTAEVVGKTARMVASDPRRFEALMRRVEQETGRPVDIPVEKVREFLLDRERYEIKTSPVASLETMVEVTPEFVPIIADMNWAVLTPPGGYVFVTSDTPVVLVNPALQGSPYGPGLLQESVEVTFPMAPKACLAATWTGPTGHVPLTRKSARQINLRTILAAQRYVFSPRPTSEVERIWIGRPVKEAADREARGKARKARRKEGKG